MLPPSVCRSDRGVSLPTQDVLVQNLSKESQVCTYRPPHPSIRPPPASPPLLPSSLPLAISTSRFLQLSAPTSPPSHSRFILLSLCPHLPLSPPARSPPSGSHSQGCARATPPLRAPALPAPERGIRQAAIPPPGQPLHRAVLLGVPAAWRTWSQTAQRRNCSHLQYVSALSATRATSQHGKRPRQRPLYSALRCTPRWPLAPITRPPITNPHSFATPSLTRLTIALAQVPIPARWL